MLGRPHHAAWTGRGAQGPARPEAALHRVLGSELGQGQVDQGQRTGQPSPAVPQGPPAAFWICLIPLGLLHFSRLPFTLSLRPPPPQSLWQQLDPEIKAGFSSTLPETAPGWGGGGGRRCRPSGRAEWGPRCVHGPPIIIPIIRGSRVGLPLSLLGAGTRLALGWRGPASFPFSECFASLPVSFGLCYFGFGVTLGSAQGFLLALHSGITSGGAEDPMGTGDGAQVG